ncbi:MAG: GspE/PulE family protein [Alistipes ihumii]
MGPTADLSRIGSGQGFLTDLIGEAFDEYASDIHFEPYEERCRIRLRIDGKLIEKYVLDRSGYASIVNQIKIMANFDISERRLPQDGRILYHRGDRKFDLRVSSLPTIYGEKVVLRLLTRHAELLELSNLGFSERQLADYESAIARPHGMALITGPTGSGKSTTLYATLRRLNRESGNILTIEDPVEYTLEGVNQVQLKEEIGLTFGAALRTFLRQDPDIIMLGEIRDADTAAMAIRSSLTGHLVFSTIHTNSAWGSVSRLRDMGVHPYLLSGTLILCAAQRLVRLLCPDCKKEAELTESSGARSRLRPPKKGGGGRLRRSRSTMRTRTGRGLSRRPTPRNSTGISASGEPGRSRPKKTEETAAGLAGNKTPVPSVARCETMRGESYERIPRQDRTHGHLMQKAGQETSVISGKQDPEAHSHKHYRPVGCERCYYTGYRGRRAIYEVIPIDDELAEAVRESRPDIAPLLEKRGITTLKDSALDLFLSGQTSLEEVLPLLRE